MRRARDVTAEELKFRRRGLDRRMDSEGVAGLPGA